MDFPVGARHAGKSVVAYSTPAKGNMLLDHCGIITDLIPFTVDRSPHKQNLLLPGVRLPIRDPLALIAARPDDVFILPWNLRDDVTAQLAEIRDWGGAFVVSNSSLQILRHIPIWSRPAGPAAPGAIDRQAAENSWGFLEPFPGDRDPCALGI